MKKTRSIFPALLLPAAVLLAALVLLAVLQPNGCATGRLPEGMDKALTESLAKELVDAVNRRDIDAILALYKGGEDVGIPSPTAEEWEVTLDSIFTEMDLGRFTSYKNISYAIVEDELMGTRGVVLLTCQYENESAVWQVLFSPEGEITGIVI